jgi:hypothetical protein
MRRQPRSGSSAAGVDTGATAASAWGPQVVGGAGAGGARGAACRGRTAGGGGAGGGVGGAGGGGGGADRRGGTGDRCAGTGGPGHGFGGAGGRGGAGLSATRGAGGGAVWASLTGGPGGRAAGGLGRSGCRRSRRNSSRSFMAPRMSGDGHHVRPSTPADQYLSSIGHPSPLNLPGSAQTRGIFLRCGRDAFGHPLSTLGGRSRQGCRPDGRDRGKLSDAADMPGGPPGSTLR